MTRPVGSFRRPAGNGRRENHARAWARRQHFTSSQVEELIQVGSDALALALQAFRQAALAHPLAGSTQQEVLKDLSSVLIQLMADERPGQEEWLAREQEPGRQQDRARGRLRGQGPRGQGQEREAIPAPSLPFQGVPLPYEAVEEAAIDHVGKALDLGRGAAHMLLCLLNEPGVYHELPRLAHLLSLRSSNYNVLRVYACRLRRALEIHGIGDAVVTGVASYMLKPGHVPAIKALLA